MSSTELDRLRQLVEDQRQQIDRYHEWFEQIAGFVHNIVGEVVGAKVVLGKARDSK